MPLFASRPPRDLLDSLTAHLGRRPKVLAWAGTQDGAVVGLVDRLLVRDASGWVGYPWHRISTGKWDGSSSRLSWVGVDLDEHAVVLTGFTSFLDLFNERVSASVMVTRRVELGSGRYVSIALRRDLAPGSAGADWQVTPSVGVDLDDPIVKARVEQELSEAAADFGIG